jgi:hypothetical protein
MEEKTADEGDEETGAGRTVEDGADGVDGNGKQSALRASERERERESGETSRL